LSFTFVCHYARGQRATQFSQSNLHARPLATGDEEEEVTHTIIISQLQPVHFN